MASDCGLPPGGFSDLAAGVQIIHAMTLRLLLLATALAACSPPLDWREVRSADVAGAAALFPCKPTKEARRVRLADTDPEMTLLACDADGALWALSHADVADPAKVAAALDQLSTAAMRNIGAAAPASAPVALQGMTPNPSAVRLRAQGVRPDGTKVRVDTAVFAKGTHVYQATVLASRPDATAADTFLTSVRWP
jgi:hypothetical protein